MAASGARLRGFAIKVSYDSFTTTKPGLQTAKPGPKTVICDPLPTEGPKWLETDLLRLLFIVLQDATPKMEIWVFWNPIGRLWRQASRFCNQSLVRQPRNCDAWCSNCEAGLGFEVSVLGFSVHCRSLMASLQHVTACNYEAPRGNYEA